MPTYKHPCPSCDKLIFRDVASCPFCGVADPFAPKRCTSCRTALEDPSWVACPRCGEPTGVGGGTAAAAPSGAALPGATPPPVTAPDQRPAPAPPAPAVPPAASTPAAPVAPPARACAGCAAPLPEGARFCTVCGTLAG